MKPTHAAQLEEGAGAFERFRRAVKTILSVPKSAVVTGRSKARQKKKRPAKD